jgi:hypothetical protein
MCCARSPVRMRRAGAGTSDRTAAQDDERFNLSGQEYLERYHIPVYVADSIRAILDAREERPLETALKYFNTVLQVAAVSCPLCAAHAAVGGAGRGGGVMAHGVLGLELRV